MAVMVEDFLLRALHTFQVRTLRSLGFNTRVALTNKSHGTGEYATDYRVDITVYGPDRKIELQQAGIAKLAMGQTISLDCRQWEQDASGDRVMIFHLIPERYAGAISADASISVSRQEIWALFTAQDHYVEYYRDSGFATGVLYQSGAFNYGKFSQERSTLIQAPKICVSRDITTRLSLMHVSFAPGYEHIASMKYVLMDADANVVARDTISIRPFEALLLDFSEVLQEQAQGPSLRFYTLNAICDNANLLPLVLNCNRSTGAMSVEHSLPPMYYGQALFGASRAQSIKELVSQPIFQDLP